MRTQRFMLSEAYVAAMLQMTQTTNSSPTIFLHDSQQTAYKPATILTPWEKKSLKAHIRYFLRRNGMNGIFKLKVTPDGWYIKSVQLAPTKEPLVTPEELAYMKREIELHEDYELNVGKKP